MKRTSVSTYIIDGKEDHHSITKAKAPSTYFFGMWTLREAAFWPTDDQRSRSAKKRPGLCAAAPQQIQGFIVSLVG